MDIQAITQRVEKESLVLRQIMAAIEKVIVGQRQVMERMLIGLLCDGHLLLEGLPGLAKTTAVKTLAATINNLSENPVYTGPSSSRHSWDPGVPAGQRFL